MICIRELTAPGTHIPSIGGARALCLAISPPATALLKMSDILQRSIDEAFAGPQNARLVLSPPPTNRGEMQPGPTWQHSSNRAVRPAVLVSRASKRSKVQILSNEPEEATSREQEPPAQGRGRPKGSRQMLSSGVRLAMPPDHLPFGALVITRPYYPKGDLDSYRVHSINPEVIQAWLKPNPIQKIMDHIVPVYDTAHSNGAYQATIQGGFQNTGPHRTFHDVHELQIRSLAPSVVNDRGRRGVARLDWSEAESNTHFCVSTAVWPAQL